VIVAEVAILAGGSLSWPLDFFGGVVLSRTDYRDLSLLKGFTFRTLCLPSDVDQSLRFLLVTAIVFRFLLKAAYGRSTSRPSLTHVRTLDSPSLRQNIT
jgi:hypothetical protein